jgi:tRNA(fMet)-specific endonuclease VapC
MIHYRKYLLDTCTISYFLSGDENVIAHFKHLKASSMCMSAISALEIEYGLGLSQSKKIDILRSKWKDFLRLIPPLEFTNSTALIAANIKTSLKQRGQMIGPYDILIAAAALESGLICVTSNIDEFSRIQDLKIEDWRV